MPIDISLDRLTESLPESFTDAQKARAQTLFLKRLSLSAHRFYGGKIEIAPRAGLYGFNWFNVWYTPGVSAVSTAIRDDQALSLSLTSRGNMVAVVSDSTRVLGDGDCGPAGGMGVMEGKAYLMKYLGGVDAVPLCIDSRGADGKNDPERIIDFVRMCQHSFGAVNLEDISQPNCFRVLDALRDSCEIPVWHDDAQGTACVTLAGVINALRLADKEIGRARFVLLGAGASNTTIARLLIADGADPARICMFDTRGSLHKGRADIKADPRFYRKWELCLSTNPEAFVSPEEALKGADVLVALSTPGPDTVKAEWIRGMAPKAIVFACANPVPEIYPYAAKQAGAFIVGTGRGDFPNQVNNSVCFPGLLKGALLCRAKAVSDGMAIRAAHSLADFAVKRGISPDSIMPRMDETEVFSEEAADVAEQAALEGLAREALPREEARARAAADIARSRALADSQMDSGRVPEPPREMLEEALSWAVAQVKEG